MADQMSHHYYAPGIQYDLQDFINLAAFKGMHYNEVTWASLHLKSWTTWLFVQQFIQVNKENIEALQVTGPLWGESTGHQWIPLTKGQ